jgi:Fe-S-cluster containining protein
VRKLKVLPPMRCDDGCGDCCGIVPVTETEYRRIERYVKEHGIEPKEHDGAAHTCPVYIDGKCAVYPVRPMICQVFGHAEDLPCSRGYNVNVPQREIDRMLRSSGYVDGAAHLLHELVPGLTESARAWAESEGINLRVDWKR